MEANLDLTGFGLAVAPVIWDSLSSKERENVENWLGNSINEKKYITAISSLEAQESTLPN